MSAGEAGIVLPFFFDISEFLLDTEAVSFRVEPCGLDAT